MKKIIIILIFIFLNIPSVSSLGTESEPVLMKIPVLKEKIINKEKELIYYKKILSEKNFEKYDKTTLKYRIYDLERDIPKLKKILQEKIILEMKLKIIAFIISSLMIFWILYSFYKIFHVLYYE